MNSKQQKQHLACFFSQKSGCALMSNTTAPKKLQVLEPV